MTSPQMNLIGVLLMVIGTKVSMVHAQDDVTEYIPDQNAWLLQSSDQGSKLKFYYQIGEESSQILYGKMILDFAEKDEVTDDSEVRMCLEWGRDDQFYKDRPMRLAFYGIVDDDEFADHRIINLLNDHSKMGLENYRWWCSVDKNSEYVSERLDEYSRVKITSSNIDKISKQAVITFEVPIDIGYFNIPIDGIYQIYPSWAIMPSTTSTDQNYVRGEKRKDLTIDLDWFYVPMDYFPRKTSEAPQTQDFVITTDLRGPLFQEHFFEAEMLNLLTLQWINSLLWVIGLPGYILIGMFFSIYNFWSFTYGFYQVFWVSSSSPYKQYFTVWNLLFNPLRKWLLNDFLFLLGFIATLVPGWNIIGCSAVFGLMYLNLITY